MAFLGFNFLICKLGVDKDPLLVEQQYQGVILFPRGHLAISGDIFGSPYPGILLNFLAAQDNTQHTIIWSKMSIMLRLGNPKVEYNMTQNLILIKLNEYYKSDILIII